MHSSLITFPGGFPPKNEALLTSYHFSRVLLCPKEALVALTNFQLGTGISKLVDQLFSAHARTLTFHYGTGGENV